MLNATLIKRIEVTKDLLILRVKPDQPFKEFLAGQYVALALPGSHARFVGAPAEKENFEAEKLIKRAYSIGSSPQEKEYLEFYVAILPEGALTSRLVTLKEGERLFIAPKITGTFTLAEVPPTANLIFVATGTGVAPFISMIRTASTWTPGRKISLLHGVRYVSDFAYQEEMNALAKANCNFAYYSTVSRPDSTWSGRNGYVQKFFEENILNLDPAHDHVFLCGNPAMCEAVQKLLEARGYNEHSRKHPGNLHLEKYW